MFCVKVMHIGKTNPEFEHIMKLNDNVRKISTCAKGKDLGATFDNTLSFDLHNYS